MYACTNGTRRSLRMTLSSKCSRVCIVIPVECRRRRRVGSGEQAARALFAFQPAGIVTEMLADLRLASPSLPSSLSHHGAITIAG